MRILSLDGGGVFGLGQAVFCRALEERARRPIGEMFDLIAGTSAGAINAACLTRPRPLTGAQLVSMYRRLAKDIFGRKRWFGRLRAQRYSPAPLIEQARAVFGKHIVQDASPRLLITAYELGVGPRFFKSWQGPETRIADAVVASASAPYFFPPHEAQGRKFIDGGVAANNPAMSAIVDAMLISSRRDLIVVSLGSGGAPAALASARLDSGWALRQAGPTVQTLLHGPSAVVDYQARKLVDRYHRIDVTVPQARAMDDASDRHLDVIEQAWEYSLGSRIATMAQIEEWTRHRRAT